MWGAHVVPPHPPTSKEAMEQEKRACDVKLPNCACGGVGCGVRGGVRPKRLEEDKPQREAGDVPALPCQRPEDELVQDQIQP